MTFTKQDLAHMKGVSIRTMQDYIKALPKNKFKKTSPGRFYSEREAKLLADLLDFEFKPGRNGQQ